MTWEKRWHPLRREWVVITAHRNTRPWSGLSAAQTAREDIHWSPDCYLCPRNTRVSGAQNPDYEGVYVFDNDHPSLAVDAPAPAEADAFFQSARAVGTNRVVCYSPDHSRSLSQLGDDELLAVVDTWAEETRKLGSLPGVRHVFPFENRGEVVGVSNPHPHGQIFALDFVPETIGNEIAAFEAYRDETGSNLFDELVAAERRDGRRLLSNDDEGVSFVPYFARFPYEAYVMPAGSPATIDQMDAQTRSALARHLGQVLRMYDALWQQPMPYILVIHQAPFGYDGDYRCHIQLHPPMRAPGLQKFLAGIETGGGNFLNDGAPEDKAAELRAAVS